MKQPDTLTRQVVAAINAFKHPLKGTYNASVLEEALKGQQDELSPAEIIVKVRARLNAIAERNERLGTATHLQDRNNGRRVHDNNINEHDDSTF